MTKHSLDPNALAGAIKPSATLAISARAGELAAAGRKIFNFSAGQPDFALNMRRLTVAGRQRT